MRSLSIKFLLLLAILTLTCLSPLYQIDRKDHKIPNHIHYVFGMTEDFGGKPFGLIHFLAIKSAFIHLKPKEIHIYYAFEPNTTWWSHIRPFVTLHPVSPRTEIFGKSLVHPAHRADILRLEILLEKGGVYLDTDVILLKPFPLDWYDKDFLMGQEGVNSSVGLGNAVIMSKPKAVFPTRWLESYKDNFKTDEWAETSVHLPKELWLEYPEDIYVVGHKRFYYPLWTANDILKVFEQNNYTLGQQQDQVAYHLWSQISYDRYLKNLTLQEIQKRDTCIKRALYPLLAEVQDNKLFTKLFIP